MYRAIVNITLEHLTGCVIIQLWRKNASRIVGDSTIFVHDLAKEAVRHLIAASVSAYLSLRSHLRRRGPIA